MKARALLTRYEVGAARSRLTSFSGKTFAIITLSFVKDRLYKPRSMGKNEVLRAVCPVLRPFGDPEAVRHLCSFHHRGNLAELLQAA